MKESDLQKEIKDFITKYYGRCWTASSGTFRSADGKRFVRGLPKGFPDLFGRRYKDNQMFFIEVKNPNGGRISPEQYEFAWDCYCDGTLHGFADSVEDAIAIVTGKYKYKDKDMEKMKKGRLKA